MPVNSHIQLPKGVLKYFADDNNQVWYLDLRTREIKYTGSSALGTEYGWYSDDAEKYLKNTIEDPITSVNAHVRKCLANEPSRLKFSERTTQRIRNYIIAAMARSDLAKQALLAGPRDLASLTDQQKNDALVLYGMPHFCQDPNFLDGYTAGLIVNKTDRPFVVPRNCFYTLDKGLFHSIIAPISPIVALALHSKEMQQTDELKYIGEIVGDESEIEKLNVRAMLYEYIYNKTFIATKEKEELERMAAVLEYSGDIFENIRMKARRES